jgi:hypothetical protein
MPAQPVHRGKHVARDTMLCCSRHIVMLLAETFTMRQTSLNRCPGKAEIESRNSFETCELTIYGDTHYIILHYIADSVYKKVLK